MGWLFLTITRIFHTYKIHFFPMAQQPVVGQGLLIIEASLPHSDTTHSVGILWTSDRPVAETSTWQHTTRTRDKHPCPRQDYNTQCQQPSGCRPTPNTAQPTRSVIKHILQMNLLRRIMLMVTISLNKPENKSSKYLAGRYSLKFSSLKLK